MNKKTKGKKSLSMQIFLKFALMNIFLRFKREYHPFLVFIEKDNEIQVEIYKEVDKLVRSNLSNDVRIMVQWQGEWRSDFFSFQIYRISKCLL